jgi:hypothetical protein
MEDDNVVLSRHDFQVLLTQAAHDGARKALTDIGLGDAEAGADIHDLRDWLKACRIIKSEALKTAVSVTTKAIIMAVVIGLAWIVGVKIGG